MPQLIRELELPADYWEKFQGTDKGSNWGRHLHCPICNDEHVHFESPRKTYSDEWGVAWAGRGSAIHIPMWCECGHHWVLRMGFHKGATFMDILDDKEERAYGSWTRVPKQPEDNK